MELHRIRLVGLLLLGIECGPSLAPVRVRSSSSQMSFLSPSEPGARVTVSKSASRGKEGSAASLCSCRGAGGCAKVSFKDACAFE